MPPFYLFYDAPATWVYSEQYTMYNIGLLVVYNNDTGHVSKTPDTELFLGHRHVTPTQIF